MISATSATFQYYHQLDGLGSTTNLTDQAGAQKANYTYDPWEKLTLPLDPISKDKYKFTGEAQDPVSGLLFLRRRYYDSSIGRFLSRDMFSGSLATPVTRNSYQYALSSPLTLKDPSGLNAIDGNQGNQNRGQVLGAFIGPRLITSNAGIAAMCLQLPPGTQIISAPTQDHVIEFQYQALLKEHQSDLLLQSDEFKLQRQADLYQQAKQTVLGSNYVIPTSIGTSKGILNAFGILNTVGEIIGRLFGSLPSADY